MIFPGTTIPKLPEGFVDRSYGNDVCSHFEKEWNGYFIEIWIAQDDKEIRECEHQYLVQIRKPEESEPEEYVEFSIEDFSVKGMSIAEREISITVFKLECKYKGGQMEKPAYEKYKLFELIKELHEYQIGDEFYIIKNNKIHKVIITSVAAGLHNVWTIPKIELEKEFLITVNLNGNPLQYYTKTQLFKTKEEAAEQFLKDSDVPVELLKVLKPEKANHTVGELIRKLQNIAPETDLGDEFWNVLKPVEQAYMRQFTGREVNERKYCEVNK